LTVRAGLLGAGHIARALAEGWRRASVDPGARPDLFVYDPVGERAAALAAACDAHACGSPAELAAASDVVVLAMRPADVGGALAALGPALGATAVVSVAAAVPLAALVAGLPAGAPVARVMPNVAAAVGQGVFLFVTGTLSARQAGEVAGLFSLAGMVVEVAEEQFDAATAVAGCGPGFAALFVEALAEAGVASGLDEQLAGRLAIGGVAGAAALMVRDGDAVALREAIATPGGMTASGVGVLESRDLRGALAAAVAAAVARARRTP
jgi:pyrroline-5-carboxylate reductase